MECDLLVIGSGPAGEKAAALAAYHGKRVVIVERSPRAGGTMVAGVATTKTMREAAIYLTSFRRRDIYGVGLDLDPALAVKGTHIRAVEVEELLTEAVESNLERHAITTVRGTARLAGNGRVEVSGDGAETSIDANVILVATGSRPFHPPGIPFDHPAVLDSDAAAALDRPVGELVIVGGGAVACELASIFAALDSRVTLVESRDRLLAFLDAEIADLLASALAQIGVRIVLGGGRPTVSADERSAVVTLPSGEVLRPDKVVVAAGRVGNTEDLGLTEAGIETDDRGLIVVDEHYATTAPGVYAAGDVIGPPALASVSMEQGRIAACHAFGLPVRDVVDAATPYGVYTIPEAAMVGMTEEDAQAAGHDIAIGRARLARNARTAITGGAEGLVKLVVDRADRRLLGAHVLGDNATELIHQAQAVIHFGGTIDYFIAATYNVPTASEAFKYAAYDALSRLEDHPTLTSNV